MDEDRAAFEDAHRLAAGAIDQGRDLGVRVYLDEAAAELVAFANADWPCIIFSAGMPLGEQLLKHDGNLLPVRRRQGVELERVLADRKLPVVCRPGDRPVDVVELAPARGFPGPDFGENIFAVVGHSRVLRFPARDGARDALATFPVSA